MIRGNFTMNDLKPNMVIELRNEKRYLVLVDNVAIGETGWLDLKNYNDDLTYASSVHMDIMDSDIMKVFNPDNKYYLIPSHLKYISDNELIWIRPKSISEVFEDITNRINKLDNNDTIELLDEIDKLLIQYENKGV